jgi:ubiquitin carboxyl-terminal hydrolase L5
VYGLIFLFKWDDKLASEKRATEPPSDRVFFANQVITNACATQAILSILLNRASDIEIGQELRDFANTVKDFPPQVRGLAIGNQETIRKAHNSFRRPEGITVIDKTSTGTEDAFHFVAYLPINGHLYELDGLQEGAINLGSCANESWLDVVTPIIQQRIEKYSGSEIRFNLMALVKDRIQVLSEQIQGVESERNTLTAAGQAVDGLDIQLADLRERLADEQSKHAAWKEENIRRKHNYIPFLYNLLRILAEKKQLLPLLQTAQKRQQDKNAAKSKSSGK